MKRKRLTVAVAATAVVAVGGTGSAMATGSWFFGSNSDTDRAVSQAL